MAGGVEAEPEKAAITERVDRAEASTEAALMVEARARNTREKAFPVSLVIITTISSHGLYIF